MNRKQLLPLLGTLFLVIALAGITITVNDPLQRQLISSFAKKAKRCEDIGNVAARQACFNQRETTQEEIIADQAYRNAHPGQYPAFVLDSNGVPQHLSNSQQISILTNFASTANPTAEQVANAASICASVGGTGCNTNLREFAVANVGSFYTNDTVVNNINNTYNQQVATQQTSQTTSGNGNLTLNEVTGNTSGGSAFQTTESQQNMSQLSNFIDQKLQQSGNLNLFNDTQTTQILKPTTATDTSGPSLNTAGNIGNVFLDETSQQNQSILNSRLNELLSGAASLTPSQQINLTPLSTLLTSTPTFSKTEGSTCTFDNQCQSGKCGVSSVVSLSKQCQPGTVDVPSEHSSEISCSGGTVKSCIGPYCSCITPLEQQELNNLAIASSDILSPEFAATLENSRTYDIYNLNEYAGCNGDYNCNFLRTAAFTGLNKGTFGKFENYVNAYQPDKVVLGWQQAGYTSPQACQSDLAKYGPLVVQSSCNAYQLNQEQLIATIDLGTTLTAEGAAIIAPFSIFGAGSIGSGLMTGLTSLSGISTLNQTSNAVEAQIKDPLSVEANAQTGMAVLSWMNLGSADLLLKGTTFKILGTNLSTSLVNGIVTGGNILADAPTALVECTSEDKTLLSCGGAALNLTLDLAFGGLDYYQGQINFRNVTGETVDIIKNVSPEVSKLTSQSPLDAIQAPDGIYKVPGLESADINTPKVDISDPTDSFYIDEANIGAFIPNNTLDELDNLLPPLNKVDNQAESLFTNLGQKPNTELSLEPSSAIKSFDNNNGDLDIIDGEIISETGLLTQVGNSIEEIWQNAVIKGPIGELLGDVEIKSLNAPSSSSPTLVERITSLFASNPTQTTNVNTDVPFRIDSPQQVEISRELVEKGADMFPVKFREGLALAVQETGTLDGARVDFEGRMWDVVYDKNTPFYNELRAKGGDAAVDELINKLDSAVRKANRNFVFYPKERNSTRLHVTYPDITTDRESAIAIMATFMQERMPQIVVETSAKYGLVVDPNTLNKFDVLLAGLGDETRINGINLDGTFIIKVDNAQQGSLLGLTGPYLRNEVKGPDRLPIVIFTNSSSPDISLPISKNITLTGDVLKIADVGQIKAEVPIGANVSYEELNNITSKVGFDTSLPPNTIMSLLSSPQTNVLGKEQIEVQLSGSTVASTALEVGIEPATIPLVNTQFVSFDVTPFSGTIDAIQKMTGRIGSPEEVGFNELIIKYLSDINNAGKNSGGNTYKFAGDGAEMIFLDGMTPEALRNIVNVSNSMNVHIANALKGARGYSDNAKLAAEFLEKNFKGQIFVKIGAVETDATLIIHEAVDGYIPTEIIPKRTTDDYLQQAKTYISANGTTETVASISPELIDDFTPAQLRAVGLEAIEYEGGVFLKVIPQEGVIPSIRQATTNIGENISTPKIDEAILVEGIDNVFVKRPSIAVLKTPALILAGVGIVAADLAIESYFSVGDLISSTNLIQALWTNYKNQNDAESLGKEVSNTNARPVGQIADNIAPLTAELSSNPLTANINTSDSIQKTESLFNNNVEYINYIATDTRNIDYHVIRLNADNAQFFVTPPSDRMTTSAFLEAYDLQIAINGDGWYYDENGVRQMSGFTASEGTQYGPIGREETLYIDKDNNISFTRPPDNEIWNAISFPNKLVENGVIIPHPEKLDRNPRTAMGMTADGVLILVTVDGKEYAEGATFEEVSNIMIEQGAVWAVMMDGGTSSTMAIEGPDGNAVTVNQPDSTNASGENTVANHFGIYITP